MPTTETLLDRLESDIKLRRICGWERKSDIPSQSTFSRAFSEFAESHLLERVHAALIDNHLGKQLVGHISRDSTEIIAREKPNKQDVVVRSPPLNQKNEGARKREKNDPENLPAWKNKAPARWTLNR